MLFTGNKYTKTYYRIIQNAVIQNRTKTKKCYYENHHIIPLACGGSGKKENLVLLTAREHFLCHWLLTKMLSGANKISMLYAMQSFRRESPTQTRYYSCITSRIYEKVKAELSYWQSKRMTGEKNPMYNRSAVRDNKLRWYNNGDDNIYVTEHTAPPGYVSGRVNMPRTRVANNTPCVSPTGEIFDNLQLAADQYNTTINAIRERIRRNENNPTHRKNKSYWSYYALSD